MSKITTLIISVLLLAIAIGAWAIFFIESERKNLEVHQIEAARKATQENEAYQAWRHATRYETFWIPLLNSRQEPRRNDTLSNREVWVKSFQHSDVKSLGRSQKYGNATYQVSTIISMNDRLSRGSLEEALHSHVSSDVIFAAVQGQWSSLIVQCKVERLDAGEWVASDYKFSRAAAKPDFAFEKVKGDN
jgi:hypothetical protein